MQTELSVKCSICGSHTWTELGRRTWERSSIACVSDYVSRRLRVLFEVWFPGRATVEFQNCACVHCGFVTNLPRVKPEDIDAKYRFLEELGQDYGSRESEEVVRKRSQRLLNHCQQYVSRGARVLDFGGGDGRLMTVFADHGYSCFLIDYNQSPLPVVQRLGATIDDASCNAEFELVVCNHVIEHVAEPVETLRSVAGILKPDGYIFVEVPMEIWKRPPLLTEPVTHVNFFVPGSLRRAMEEACLQVVECRLTTYLHPSGRVLPAVIAIGKKTKEITRPAANGYAEVCSCLKPGLRARFNRSWSLRENLPAMIKYRLKRWSRHA